MIALEVSTALGVLSALSCDSDPAWFKKEETTAAGLEDVLARQKNTPFYAHHVRIVFYGGPATGGGLRKKTGTLAGMVRDRLMLK